MEAIPFNIGHMLFISSMIEYPSIVFELTFQFFKIFIYIFLIMNAKKL